MKVSLRENFQIYGIERYSSIQVLTKDVQQRSLICMCTKITLLSMLTKIRMTYHYILLFVQSLQASSYISDFLFHCLYSFNLSSLLPLTPFIDDYNLFVWRKMSPFSPPALMGESFILRNFCPMLMIRTLPMVAFSA